MLSYHALLLLDTLFVAMYPMGALQSVEAVAKVTQSRYDVATHHVSTAYTARLE
jgi:hypothetical protein